MLEKVYRLRFLALLAALSVFLGACSYGDIMEIRQATANYYRAEGAIENGFVQLMVSLS